MTEVAGIAVCVEDRSLPRFPALRRTPPGMGARPVLVGQPDVLGVEGRRRIRPVRLIRGRMKDQPPLEGEKHEEYPQIYTPQQQNHATKASPPGALTGNLRSERDE